MKKLLLLNLILLLSISAFAQTDSKTNPDSQFKLGLAVTPKMGISKYKETGAVPLNGFVNGLDLLLSIPIFEDAYVQTGAGFFGISGNTVKNGEAIYMQNGYLQIPLKFKIDYVIFENKSTNQRAYLTTAAGINANMLSNQTIETESTSTSKFIGWSFGFVAQIGVKYNLSKKTNLVFSYDFQGDSGMKKDGIERRIVNLNTFSVGMEFKLK